MKTRLARFTLLCAMLGCSLAAGAQTIVKGIVRDAITKEPLPFVSVYFEGGKGINSNDDGTYNIQTNNGRLTTLVFSFTGYKKVTKKIQPQQEQTLNIDLEVTNSLNTLVVKSKRGKYRNKDNPAVELIDLVIANKSKNRITAYNYAQYQQYEKLELSLTNKPEKMAKNRLFRNYKFILDNVDTTKLEGKSLLPIYLEEKLSNKYFRKNPSKEKTIILAEKKVNFGDFLDDAGISSYLKRLYADIDIYDNNIVILTTQFLSPIADMSPTFYRFYIRDTVEQDGIKLVKLNFMPRNTADLLFRGIIYVTLDGNYSVQKIEMSVSKKANLNWTRELKIYQNFEKNSEGRYSLVKSSMLAEFALRQNASGGILGERTVSFKNILTNQPAPDSIYNGKDEVIAYVPGSNTDSFWLNSRHEQLTDVETKVYANIDSLRNMKSYKNAMQILTLVLSGYVKVGKFEIGNTNTFYSFNPVEGFRLRVGGRSTPDFSKHWYLEGYGAYGFKDKQYKYLVGAAYSFNGKSIYTYPLDYIKFVRQYETKIPGQELVFASEDNFFLSFKRGKNDRWLYNDLYKLEYIKEFGKNLQITATFKHNVQTPAGAISYDKITPIGITTNVPNITTSQLGAELRWAPREQFYQGKNFRRPIYNKFPIFRVRFEAGIKGLFGGEYNYQQLTVAAFKRFYLSQLGYADITMEAGKTFGTVPFPLLTIHRANQTYAYQLYSYNLMNFMEFVSDHYAGTNMDFYMNGFFLNKVPLLKKLKLREVASFKLLYGGLTAKNDPTKNPSQFRFPIDKETGLPTTFSLNKTPYMEVSVGLANIFKVLRVDLIRRLTYQNNPDISTWGIRTRIRADF